MRSNFTASDCAGFSNASNNSPYSSKYLFPSLTSVSCPLREKAIPKSPVLNKWQHAMLCENDLPVHFGSTPRNIGVVLGSRSNSLLDVDIDDDIALRLARHFLPDTGMIFGRESRPRSHWLYRSTTTKPKRYSDEARDVIVEIRGDGQHTVFPGSVHLSGEDVRFDSDGPASSVEYEKLELACLQLCIATLLLRHWNKGSRHELALAAAGLLANSVWKEQDALKIISAVATEAEDN